MRDGENIRQVAELGVDWIGMIFWDRSPRNVTMIPTHAGIIPDRAAIPEAPEAPPSAPEGATIDPSLHTASKTIEAPSGAVGGAIPSGAVGGAFPKRVGVFVDEMPQSIITRVVSYQLDLVQLHGHESPTLIRNLRATLDPDIRPGLRFIKAITIPAADRAACREAIATYKQYEDCVDYFLFDTRCPTAGGSGQQFDWSVLSAYDGHVPFLLSGGIGPDDAPRLNELFASASSAVGGFPADRCIGIDLNSRFETEPGMKDIQKLKQFIDQLQ